MQRCHWLVNAAALLALLCVAGYFYSRYTIEPLRTDRRARIAYFESYCSQIQAELETKYKLEPYDKRCKYLGRVNEPYIDIAIDSNS